MEAEAKAIIAVVPPAVEINKAIIMATKSTNLKATIKRIFNGSQTERK
jgi:hypothetical protein